MKNFLLFIYDFEYPRGGFRDYKGAFINEKQAHKAAEKYLTAKSKDWGCAIDEVESNYHIFHISTRRVISPSRKKTALRSIQSKGIY